MLYPGYIPQVEPCVLHYGLEFSVGNWSFDKANWREQDMTNVCWKFFPNPPNPAFLAVTNMEELRRDTVSIECIRTLNEALYLHHKRRGCPDSATEKEDEVVEGTRKPPELDVNKDWDAREEAQIIDENKDVDGFEVGEKDVDKDWDERNEAQMIGEKDKDEVVEKTEEWDDITSSSRVKTALRKLSDSAASLELVTDPEYCMVALWSVSFFLFVLMVYYVYSSQRQKQKPSKSKTKRAMLSGISNGEPYRIATNAE